ncbi:MAG: NAD(P)H-dependent oxidoreductase [Pseudomonadota bacterium]
MALEAARAAQVEVDVLLEAADTVTAEVMLEADAYLFVGPENLGGLSGAMKEMLDRCYYPLLGKIEGRAYGSIIAAGSDGTGAQRQLDRIVTGWRLKRVADGLIVNFDAQTPEDILAKKALDSDACGQCRELGSAFGAGLSMGVF